jgi:hypothetical protein
MRAWRVVPGNKRGRTEGQARQEEDQSCLPVHGVRVYACVRGCEGCARGSEGRRTLQGRRFYAFDLCTHRPIF